MSDTLGELMYRVSKTPIGAGVDRDLLIAIFNERMFEILRSFPWQRLRVDSILQTTAVYETGTVTFTEGSTTITGSSTVWTSAMTGRFIRKSGDNAYYVFTYVSATSGTLDRAYEEDTASGASYKIFDNIYTLPSDCGNLESIRVLKEDRELDQITMEELDQIDPHRGTYGPPTLFALFEDDSSTPPVSQVELYPIPTTSVGLPIRYTKQVARLTVASDIILPWISSECLVAGVLAELGDAPKEQRFQKLLLDMQREETRRQIPMQIQMADRYVEHRFARLVGDLQSQNRRNQMPDP